MNKEAYVSVEVAKLLKEKGFDEKTVYHYTNCDVLQHNIVYNEYKNSEMLNAYSAPTQQMACQWLREVYKIDISVTPDDGSWWIKITELESWSSVFNGKVLNSDDIKSAYQGSTNTKEECYEAALWYVLKNLI